MTGAPPQPKDALVALGVPGDKLKTISYGKERPLCTDATEDCYRTQPPRTFLGHAVTLTGDVDLHSYT